MPLENYDIVLGLEVHAQLLTNSKLFSTASTAFGDPPNTHTTEVCLALPGALPVLNEQAVEFAIRTGLALGCTVNERSEWSRKHYFYPDSPKAYQITQFEFPICEWGSVAVQTDKGSTTIRVRRIHIEEDAGKSMHEGSRSLVDLNRAGTPLLEIVTEPDFTSVDEVVAYLKSLRETLMYVGVNDGNLEEGSFRCDANVSVKPKGRAQLGTRCELKNLNSFRFIKQAIEFEAQRHVDVIESGGVIEQETRLFDVARGETRSMRSKEDAQDYRYFPDPDLPPLVISKERIERVRNALPELPRAKRERYITTLGLPEYDTGVLTAERAFAELFEACVAEAKDAKKVSNWFLGELSRLLNDRKVTVGQLKFTPKQLAQLIDVIDRGVISHSVGKSVFEEMFDTGESADAIIARKGLAQVSDVGALEAAVDAVIAANPSQVASYKAGKEQLLSFLMGAVMKSLKGKGNPKVINELLVKKLKG